MRLEQIEKMTDAQRAGGFLSKEQLDLIRAEFGCTLAALTDEDFQKLYDRLADIEVEETIAAGDGELSERGKQVESIITIIGNEIYRVEDEAAP